MPGWQEQISEQRSQSPNSTPYFFVTANHRGATVKTMTHPKVLGVIPARGGSKGLPRKNILHLAGKPLIAYTIEVALRSALLDRVMVSTDDDEIAKVAREYGAEVPFSRPPNLAQDDSLVFPVLIHAVNWLCERQGFNPEYVMLLQPTSPLREVDDIDSAANIAIKTEADSVVSVGAVHQHPYWMKRVVEDGRLTSYLSSDQFPYRRQELPSIYALNGAIYLVSTKVLLKQQTFYTDRTYAYIMPPERSLDVDSKWDLYLAELILEDKARRARD